MMAIDGYISGASNIGIVVYIIGLPVCYKIDGICDKMGRDLSGLVLEDEDCVSEKVYVSESRDFVKYAAERAMDGGGMQL